MRPYSNDYMIYDEVTGHYVLTERALEDNGVQIRQRLTRNRATNATAVINRLLGHVSDMVYNYIHKFNFDNKRQDMIIATIPSCRYIIQKAMLSQCEYLLMNGDLSRSVEADKRAMAIDDNARAVLDTAIPELGYPITYAGGY